MMKHARFLYQPVLPLGKGGRPVTGSRAHRVLALKAAEDGTVLLKNDGTLPLKRGAKVCLFGTGAGRFLFGGGGSGMVYSGENVTLTAALEEAARQGEIGFFSPLAEFYEAEMGKISLVRPQIGSKYGPCPDRTVLTLPVLPEELYRRAAEFGDTAVFCVSRYSAEGDLNGDRTGGKGDFALLDEERELLARLCSDFASVVVVVNSCGPVSMPEYRDEPRVGAVLYPLYGGCMAGQALVNLLLGKSFPSGHLQHTLANRLEDYPSTAGFGKHEDHEDYTEDIFVGYRYFETLAPEKVAYPFGFGLSYTEFAVACRSAGRTGMRVKLTVSVKNTGARPGREVVQVYLSAPQGRLGKAARVLCAFAKTRRLEPGEEQLLPLSFDLKDFASFDDLGKIAQSAFVLERGEYAVHVGVNVRDTAQCLAFRLEEDVVCRRCHPYMAPRQLPERLTASGAMEKLPAAAPAEHPPVRYELTAQKPERELTLAAALETGRMDEFLASLTDRDLAELLYGHPMMNASSTNGIGIPPRYVGEDDKLVPLVPTADGPAGLRLRRGLEIQSTYFPCASVVAQSWDLSLARRLGAAIALEVKENNIGIWLAPGMNIHRNPMAGRNFEYYSEDPLTTGLFAASCVRGVQSRRIAATVKHFCCNNREYCRRVADSRVSQRALREIYLRGFEIAVKRGKPWALMTSYNPVNGVQSSANWEAINGILRGEWGFDGVVMTDWRTFANLEDELAAGGDVKMPEPITRFYDKAPASFDLEGMIADGTLDRGVALAAARHILTLMKRLE